PSAAAELVVPDAREVLAALRAQDRRMARHVRHRLERLGDRLALYRLRAAGRTLLVHRWRARVDGFAQRLADLDPDRVLGRGYSRTVLERTGATLLRAADARPGDRLRTHLAKGELASRVENTTGNPPSS
ncbi:MAG: hypothetical protein NTX40_01905, partial [Planctomycetota bacterium]|nr:hypothetical protein [Planctomycetota bacterium]